MGLERFLAAQDNGVYDQALLEIKCGKKQSHWMWFVFPQLKGLGSSPTANYYGITDLEEAAEYLRHPILGKRLSGISGTLLELPGTDATAVFGYPDDLKLHSCMTLFSQVEDADNVFKEVIEKYFKGKADTKTIRLLKDVSGSRTV